MNVVHGSRGTATIAASVPEGSPGCKRARIDKAQRLGARTARSPSLRSPREEPTMSTHRKPSIVFAHGLWADGSCFSKVIPTLQAEGHEVIAAQNSLDTLK